MKTVLVVIILVAVILGAGYFGLPILIEKETSGLKADVQSLKEKIEKMEEESKIAPLQPAADAEKIIKVVNSLIPKVTALEDKIKKDISATDEVIRSQRKATDEAFKNQSEAIDKINKDIEAKMHKNMFYSLMETIRGNVLKVKLDLAEKNVGMAKNDLDLVSESFEKVKALATLEERKVIDEFDGILKKAKRDIDTDLPSANNRINLLWNESSKLLLNPDMAHTK